MPLPEEKGRGLLQLNSCGEILNVNETLSSWLGYEPQELLRGVALQEILQDPSAFTCQYLQEGQTTDLSEHTLLLRAKDKTIVKLQATFKEQARQGVLQLVLRPFPALPQESSFYQIELDHLKQENKGLKQVQRVLRRSMEKFRVLAEYSPDVIMQFDRQHRHLFVNTQVENFLAYRVEDFLGKTHEEIGFPSYFSSICHNALEQVFTTGERLRLELELPNGIWLDWFLIPEFSPTREVVTIVTNARDITEQKKTSHELQKSQQKLKDAFEVTKLSSWEYGVREDCLLLNEELRDLLGIHEKPDLISGKQFWEKFLLPEEHGKLLYIIREASEHKYNNFKEVTDYRIRRLDGDIIHVLSSIRLEVTAAGEVLRAFGTAQDITQLRLTEQELEEYRTGLERLVETRTLELKKSEEKLADALRLANLGTWEFDPVAECFMVSDNVLEIFGTTREIEGGNMIPISRMRDSIYPDDQVKYLKSVERVTHAVDDFFSDHLELRISRSDGEIRHLYVSIKIAKTRNFIKYYGTLQDISTIRFTEHEKNRLTAIIETTSDIVSIAGVDGRIQYLNKAGREFFGIRNDEALAQKTIFNLTSARFTKVLSRKELRHADKWGTWSGQNRYVRHDGREVHVSQVIVSHKSPEGQVQCYSAILRDMSEQKKIEQDLIFKNNELDTFIYRASHDLRGPIATMMGLNQIVKYEIEDAAALKYFELYNSQILRLHNITVSLIELTKIKDRNCEISTIDFRNIWSAVQTNIAKLSESAGVMLQDCIEDLADFRSDAHLIEIVLYNLVENSIRYRRSEVEAFVRLEIQASKERDQVIIKVSDNGIGIDSQLQHKIYNMFFRGTDRSKGPGLGLYILKNAVEKIGGRTTLYSVPYKGTTFKIELPSL
ncbi:PAS domain-containing protein [Flammeovirgaceae bacterium 311]|nr:PAS domain-containing protein [Flammeovirgaceae bacterium 311]